MKFVFAMLMIAFLPHVAIALSGDRIVGYEERVGFQPLKLEKSSRYYKIDGVREERFTGHSVCYARILANGVGGYIISIGLGYDQNDNDPSEFDLWVAPPEFPLNGPWTYLEDLGTSTNGSKVTISYSQGRMTRRDVEFGYKSNQVIITEAVVNTDLTEVTYFRRLQYWETEEENNLWIETVCGEQPQYVSQAL